MSKEVAGTWRNAEDVFAYRASYQVNATDRSITIDGVADVRGQTRPLHIWIFSAEPQFVPHVARIVELSIFACLRRMGSSP
jgi:hypothetical protein